MAKANRKSEQHFLNYWKIYCKWKLELQKLNLFCYSYNKEIHGKIGSVVLQIHQMHRQSAMNKIACCSEKENFTLVVLQRVVLHIENGDCDNGKNNNNNNTSKTKQNKQEHGIHNFRRALELLSYFHHCCFISFLFSCSKFRFVSIISFCSPQTIIYKTFQLFLNLCRDDRMPERRRNDEKESERKKRKKIYGNSMNKHSLQLVP